MKSPRKPSVPDRCPREYSTRIGFLREQCQAHFGSWSGHPSDRCFGDGGSAWPNQRTWVHANTFTGLTAPPDLTKAFGHLKGFAVSQHVEGRARELVRECLHCDHGHAPRSFAIVKTPRLGTTAHRNGGSFDEGPGKILVAVLCVAFTFLLAVRDALAFDAAAVGTELPDALGLLSVYAWDERKKTAEKDRMRSSRIRGRRLR